MSRIRINSYYYTCDLSVNGDSVCDEGQHIEETTAKQADKAVRLFGWKWSEYQGYKSWYCPKHSKAFGR